MPFPFLASVWRGIFKVSSKILAEINNVNLIEVKTGQNKNSRAILHRNASHTDASGSTRGNAKGWGGADEQVDGSGRSEG